MWLPIVLWGEQNHVLGHVAKNGNVPGGISLLQDSLESTRTKEEVNYFNVLSSFVTSLERFQAKAFPYLFFLPWVLMH